MSISTTNVSLNAAAPFAATQNNHKAGALSGHKVAVLTRDDIIDQAVKNERVGCIARTIVGVAAAVAALAGYVFTVFSAIVCPPLLALSLTMLIGGVAVAFTMLTRDNYASAIDQDRKGLKTFIEQNFKDMPLTPQMIVRIHEHRKMAAKPAPYYPQQYAEGSLERRECQAKVAAHHAKIAANLQRLQTMTQQQNGKTTYQQVAAKLSHFFASQA